MSKQLALFGGTPVRLKAYSPYCSCGDEEKKAVLRVMEKGRLSCFYGSNTEEFFGGPEVQALEREWEKAFNVKHAVSVNSATSALFAAVGALGLGPGDEVIVPPTTMSASVTGVPVYGAIPRFVDIEADRYCINPEKIEAAVNDHTRAIIVVHLFGQPAAMDEIMEIAEKYNLKVIEDAAQAPLAKYHDRNVGTFGDIGVFSLNCHKTIQCGEGGIAVTNDDELCKRLQLIRNHAEVIITEGFSVQNIVNMLGYNYRLTELLAAIAREQLKKLPSFNKERIHLADYLRNRLKKFDFFEIAPVRKGCTHVYYVFPWNYKPEKLGISRDTLIKALHAEGIDQVSGGYVTPLYLQELYRKKIAFKRGYPFSLPENQPNPDYSPGICPIAERLWKEEFFVSNICLQPSKEKDLDDFVKALEKIVDNLESLKKYEKKF